MWNIPQDSGGGSWWRGVAKKGKRRDGGFFCAAGSSSSQPASVTGTAVSSHAVLTPMTPYMPAIDKFCKTESVNSVVPSRSPIKTTISGAAYAPQSSVRSNDSKTAEPVSPRQSSATPVANDNKTAEPVLSRASSATPVANDNKTVEPVSSKASSGRPVANDNKTAEPVSSRASSATHVANNVASDTAGCEHANEPSVKSSVKHSKPFNRKLAQSEKALLSVLKFKTLHRASSVNCNIETNKSESVRNHGVTSRTIRNDSKAGESAHKRNEHSKQSNSSSNRTSRTKAENIDNSFGFNSEQCKNSEVILFPSSPTSHVASQHDQSNLKTTVVRKKMCGYMRPSNYKKEGPPTHKKSTIVQKILDFSLTKKSQEEIPLCQSSTSTNTNLNKTMKGDRLSNNDHNNKKSIDFKNSSKTVYVTKQMKTAKSNNIADINIDPAPRPTVARGRPRKNPQSITATEKLLKISAAGKASPKHYKILEKSSKITSYFNEIKPFDPAANLSLEPNNTLFDTRTKKLTDDNAHSHDRKSPRSEKIKGFSSLKKSDCIPSGTKLNQSLPLSRSKHTTISLDMSFSSNKSSKIDHEASTVESISNDVESSNDTAEPFSDIVESSNDVVEPFDDVKPPNCLIVDTVNTGSQSLLSQNITKSDEGDNDSLEQSSDLSSAISNAICLNENLCSSAQDCDKNVTKSEDTSLLFPIDHNPAESLHDTLRNEEDASCQLNYSGDPLLLADPLASDNAHCVDVSDDDVDPLADEEPASALGTELKVEATIVSESSATQSRDNCVLSNEYSGLQSQQSSEKDVSCIHSEVPDISEVIDVEIDKCAKIIAEKDGADDDIIIEKEVVTDEVSIVETCTCNCENNHIHSADNFPFTCNSSISDSPVFLPPTSDQNSRSTSPTINHSRSRRSSRSSNSSCVVNIVDHSSNSNSRSSSPFLLMKSKKKKNCDSSSIPCSSLVTIDSSKSSTIISENTSLVTSNKNSHSTPVIASAATGTIIIAPSKRMILQHKQPFRKIVNILGIETTHNTGKKARPLPSRGSHNHNSSASLNTSFHSDLNTSTSKLPKKDRKRHSTRSRVINSTEMSLRCDSPSTDDTLPDIEHDLSSLDGSVLCVAEDDASKLSTKDVRTEISASNLIKNKEYLISNKIVLMEKDTTESLMQNNSSSPSKLLVESSSTSVKKFKLDRRSFELKMTMQESPNKIHSETSPIADRLAGNEKQKNLETTRDKNFEKLSADQRPINRSLRKRSQGELCEPSTSSTKSPCWKTDACQGDNNSKVFTPVDQQSLCLSIELSAPSNNSTADLDKSRDDSLIGVKSDPISLNKLQGRSVGLSTLNTSAEPRDQKITKAVVDKKLSNTVPQERSTKCNITFDEDESCRYALRRKMLKSDCGEHRWDNSPVNYLHETDDVKNTDVQNTPSYGDIINIKDSISTLNESVYAKKTKMVSDEKLLNKPLQFVGSSVCIDSDPSVSNSAPKSCTTDDVDSANESKCDTPDAGRRPKRQPKASKKLLESVESGSHLGLMSMSKLILEKMSQETKEKRKQDAREAQHRAAEKMAKEALLRAEKKSLEKPTKFIEMTPAEKQMALYKKPKEICATVRPKVNAEPRPIQMIENIDKVSDTNRKIGLRKSGKSLAISNEFEDGESSIYSNDSDDNFRPRSKSLKSRLRGTHLVIDQVEGKQSSLLKMKRSIDEVIKPSIAKKQKISGVVTWRCCTVTYTTEDDLQNHLIRMALAGDAGHRDKLEQRGFRMCSRCPVWILNTMMSVHMQNIHNIQQDKASVLKVQSLVINLKKQTVPTKSICKLDKNGKPVKQKAIVNLGSRINVNSEISEKEPDSQNVQNRPVLRGILCNKNKSNSQEQKKDVKKKSVTLKSPNFKKSKIIESSDSNFSEGEGDSESSDDVPLSQLRCHKKSKKKTVGNIDTFDDDDEYRPAALGEESSSLPVSERSFSSSIMNNKGTVQIKASLRSSKKTSQINDSLSRKDKLLKKQSKKEITALNKKKTIAKKGRLKKAGSSNSCTDESQSEDDSRTQSEDESDDSGVEPEDKENNPLVELEMYTFNCGGNNNYIYPTLLLMDPKNSRLKIYANVDTIFVSDVSLGDKKGQSSYLSDNNNIIYVSSKHNIFPNPKDLENHIPQPIIVMKTTKLIDSGILEKQKNFSVNQNILRDANVKTLESILSPSKKITNNNVSDVLSQLIQKSIMSPKCLKNKDQVQTIASTNKKVLSTSDSAAPIITQSAMNEKNCDYADKYNIPTDAIDPVDDLALCEPSLQENAVSKDLLAHLIDTTLNVSDTGFDKDDLPDVGLLDYDSCPPSGSVTPSTPVNAKSPRSMDADLNSDIDNYFKCDPDAVTEKKSAVPFVMASTPIHAVGTRSTSASDNILKIVNKPNLTKEQNILLSSSGKTTIKFIRTSELLKAKSLNKASIKVQNLNEHGDNTVVSSSVSSISPKDAITDTIVQKIIPVKNDNICTDLIDMATLEPIAEPCKSPSPKLTKHSSTNISIVPDHRFSMPNLLPNADNALPTDAKNVASLENHGGISHIKSPKKSAWSFLDDDSDEFLSTLEFTDTLQSPSRLDSDESSEVRPVTSPSKQFQPSPMYLPKIPSNLLDDVRNSQPATANNITTAANFLDPSPASSNNLRPSGRRKSTKLKPMLITPSKYKTSTKRQSGLVLEREDIDSELSTPPSSLLPTFISPPGRNRPAHFNSTEESSPSISSYSNLAYSCLSDNDIFGLWPGVSSATNSPQLNNPSAPKTTDKNYKNVHESSPSLPTSLDKDYGAALECKPVSVQDIGISPVKLTDKVLSPKKSKGKQISNQSYVCAVDESVDKDSEDNSLDDLPNIGGELLSVHPRETSYSREPNERVNHQSPAKKSSFASNNTTSPGKVLPKSILESPKSATIARSPIKSSSPEKNTSTSGSFKSPGKVFPTCSEDECEDDEGVISPRGSSPEGSSVHPCNSTNGNQLREPYRRKKIVSIGKSLDRVPDSDPAEDDSTDEGVLSPPRHINDSDNDTSFSSSRNKATKFKLAVSFDDGSIPLEFSLDSLQRNRALALDTLSDNQQPLDETVNSFCDKTLMFDDDYRSTFNSTDNLAIRHPRAYRPEIIDSDDLACISDAENISKKSVSKLTRSSKHKSRKLKKKKKGKRCRSRDLSAEQAAVTALDDHSIKMKINLKGMTSEMVTQEIESKKYKGKKRKYDVLEDSLSPGVIQEKRLRKGWAKQINYAEAALAKEHKSNVSYRKSTDASDLTSPDCSLVISPTSVTPPNYKSNNSKSLTKTKSCLMNVENYFTQDCTNLPRTPSPVGCRSSPGSSRTWFSPPLIDSDDDECISPLLNTNRKSNTSFTDKQDSASTHQGQPAFQSSDEECEAFDGFSTPEQQINYSTAEDNDSYDYQLDSTSSPSNATATIKQSDEALESIGDISSDNIHEDQEESVVSPRPWLLRDAKLKATILIQDHQEGISDSKVEDSIPETQFKTSGESLLRQSSKLSTETEEQNVSLEQQERRHNFYPGPLNKSNSEVEFPDDRIWHSRVAKLKAQIMINDQQNGVTDSAVSSTSKEPCTISSSSYPRLPSNDIRNFFPSISPVNHSSTVTGGISKSSNQTSDKLPRCDIRSFFSPTTAAAQEMSRGIKRQRSDSEDDDDEDDVEVIQRGCVSPTSEEAMIPVHSLKLWYDMRCSRMALVVKEPFHGPFDFEGFTKLGRRSANRARTLHQMVGLLNRENWGRMPLFEFPIDYLFYLDEDKVYSQLE